MISRFVQELRNVRDVVCHGGVNASTLARIETEEGLYLPAEHKALLQLYNGICAYAGYVRLFGVCTSDGIDLMRWNQPEYWKFAWKNRCSLYWCFGETAWGDQYAYSLESLKAGKNGEVVFLDVLSMTPEVIAGSFVEFLENEFIRSAIDPYDAMIKRARQKLGPLEPTSNLVYLPSVLLGGAEEIENVQKMDARSAMICNGDIALQLDEGPAAGAVTAVEPYEDENGRLRLRLVWS